jgi:IPT/TIG domain
MTSFTPFFLNNFNKSRWATGSAIVGTSLAQAINLVAPDQTIKELNNLDDQAFRDGKLIPNNTQVRILVFLQKRSLAEGIGEIVPAIKAANQVTQSPCPAGYKDVPGSPGNCYPRWEDNLKNCVKKLVCDPGIVKLALGSMVIVGDKIDYIQRVVVDTSVTSQEVNPGNKQAEVGTTPPLDPQHGTIGSTLTINGKGFGLQKNTSTVKFDDAQAAATDILSWNDTKIQVKVPAGAKTGDATVIVINDGNPQTIGKFTVDAATAPAPIVPLHGAIGTQVTLNGKGFGPRSDSSIVKFGDTQVTAADIVSWTDSKIEVKVPAGAKTGDVVVVVLGKSQTIGTFTIP